jgi:hypothetical protein
MLAADDGDQCQPRESIDAANNLRRTIGAIENKKQFSPHPKAKAKS